MTFVRITLQFASTTSLNPNTVFYILRSNIIKNQPPTIQTIAAILCSHVKRSTVNGIVVTYKYNL